MNPIVRIREKLKQYPALEVEYGKDYVRVEAPSPEGFPVSFHLEGNGAHVRLAGWREYFESEGDALECFGFAFTERCRLRVESRGKKDCSWTLELFDEGAWHEDLSVGLRIRPVLGKKRMRYLQNRLPIQTSAP
jgi:hypothetical protein